MQANPFSPIFGGKPGLFFGRKDILARFDAAMLNDGSEDRALFITGTRGSGKTALLEQLSRRASSRRRAVIDLGPHNVTELLARSLVRHAETTRVVSPQASVSVFGIGGGLSAGSVAKTTRYDAADLPLILTETCEKLPHGLLVTIDEVQKVPLTEMSSISNAFQLASRKGYDVMLAIAGLPRSHDEVIHYEGCTFMRRATHEELGLFSWEEAQDALVDAFAKLDALELDAEAMDAINSASYGHPYLMQLLGYHLVESLKSSDASAPYHVGNQDVQEIIPPSVATYEQRALRPLLDELSEAERSYLVAMGETIASKGGTATVVRSSEVAAALRKQPKQLSTVRDRLLGEGIIAVPEYGSLMFAVPYLRTYVLRQDGHARNVRLALERGV